MPDVLGIFYLMIQIRIYEPFSAEGSITNILGWGHDKVNLFELHIKSDTVIIRYTTTEGKQRDFKFPLAGFKEKYLEQFV